MNPATNLQQKLRPSWDTVIPELHGQLIAQKSCRYFIQTTNLLRILFIRHVDEQLFFLLPLLSAEDFWKLPALLSFLPSEI